LKLLVKKARVKKSSKKGKNEENTQIPSSHDGEHRPTMPGDKFEVNLHNFEARSTSYRATMGHIVPRWTPVKHRAMMHLNHATMKKPNYSFRNLEKNKPLRSKGRATKEELSRRGTLPTIGRGHFLRKASR
jgi:hypothetical protein